ncbi:MFS general substrate transporter [Pyrenophora tritici-repentis]|nr:MFS general substrate transporter [Pyrenophora tritici-repentis]
MPASAVHKLFDIHSASKVASPAPTHQQSVKKSAQGLHDAGVLPDIGLDQIAPAKTRDKLTTSLQNSSGQGVAIDVQKPATLNDVETIVGALIPYIESHYHISYTIMSLVFVGNAFGFIAAAFFTDMILKKIGRGKAMVLGDMIQLSAYIILVCTPPYPLVVVSAVLGAAHGSYGIGGIVAPIVGTALVSNGVLWSRFYCLAVGLRLCCIVFTAYAFWNYDEHAEPAVLAATTSAQAAEADKRKDLKVAVENKVTIFGALFIFAYQGAEVSISGWIISYLINYRDGNPAKVGYVTAGFWGGITLGRFVLTHLAPRLGEKNFVVILTLGTFIFQLLAWLVPNVIGNAVAVSLLGLLLGPVYPCAQTIFSRLLPRHIQTTAIGFIGGAGSSGGAVAPFTTGTGSRKLAKASHLGRVPACQRG